MKITLEKTNFFVAQPSQLTIGILNTEETFITNLIFSLKLPVNMRLQKGSKQVNIPKIAPHEKYRHTITIVPKSVGTSMLTLVNFSYRDGSGKVQHINQQSCQITIKESLPPPPKAKIELRIDPVKLALQEWGKLTGKIRNVGQITIQNIKIRVTGSIETNQNISLPYLPIDDSKNFSISIRPLESGDCVPISIETEFIDQVKRKYAPSFSNSLKVVKTKNTLSNVTYDFREATIGGGVSGGNYEGDVIYNYASQTNLAEAAQEIQELLEQLAKTYPNDSKIQIAAKAEKTIKNDPTLKQKSITALKSGSLEALKTHPIGAFIITAI